MKQITTWVIMVGLVLAGLWYLNGPAFFIGLGVVILTTIIVGAFICGAKFAKSLLISGAEIASKSSTSIEARIKAELEYQRELLKHRKPSQTNDFPRLPPPTLDINNFDDFHINGLDDEVENN